MANDSLEFVQRGKVCIVRRQYAEAVKICRLGLLAQPTLLEGRLVLGMALSALERWDEALAEMRVALESDPKSALAWLLKGEALIGKRDYRQAEKSLHRAKELDPSNKKADQLLSEIQIARAAGFDGITAEPTDTKEYPAKSGDPFEGSTSVTDPGGVVADPPPLQIYDDDTTEVDANPSAQVQQLVGRAKPGERREVRTPIEAHRRIATTPGDPPGAHSGPAIALESADIIRVGSPARESYDDGATSRRPKRQSDEDAGTRPASPEPVRHRARAPRPSEPEPARREPAAIPKGLAAKWDEDSQPLTTKRKPLAARAQVSTREGAGRVTRMLRALGVDQLSHTWTGLTLISVVVVLLVSVGTVVLVRQWRVRTRAVKRQELAGQKLSSGNYPGFQAAESLLRQILADHDDPESRAQRARLLSQMAFEFGDDPAKAERAVAGLGSDASQAGQAARVYLAMARGEIDRAQRTAQILRSKFPDGEASYLVGRTELLQGRPDTAVDALRLAADRAGTDPLLWHGLGLAEAAAQHDSQALEAYRRALDLNANHIATLIDRARLQVRRGQPADRDPARVTLEGVVTKLVADSSPGQRARSYLGLAELELERRDVEVARRDLASAESLRSPGDVLLSEELARLFVRTFQLDEAKREAEKAAAGSSRLEPRLVQADVALRRGRPEEALAILKEAGASRADALVLRALANHDLGRIEAARLDVAQALRVQPDLLSAKLALARVEIADGHPERAQRELDRLERAYKLPEVAALLGAVFLASHSPDRERARFWLSEALRRDPLFVEARLAMARLEGDEGHLVAARGHLDAVLKLDSGHAPARRQLAAVDFASGDPAAARTQLDLLAEKEADVPSFLDAARAHLAIGDFAGARERLERARRLVPSGLSIEEWADVAALIALRDHRPDDALGLLTKVMPSAARGETAALVLFAHLDRDQPEQAARAQLSVPSKLRGSAELLVARARLSIESGHSAQAGQQAQAALDRLRGPDASRWLRAEALLVLGRSQWEQGNFRPAERSLASVIEHDPANARAFYYLGLVDEELGKRGEAIAAMEKAVKTDPRFADAEYNLGLLRQESDERAAREAFERYLQLAPHGTYADEARHALGETVKQTSSPPRKRHRGH